MEVFNVVQALPEEIPAWLALAHEVEPLFGPMVDDPGFHRALKKNIARGTAYCIRENGQPAGAPLMGGLLFSPKPPKYVIGWLAVAEAHRRSGIGQALVAHALSQVEPPATISLTTFGPDNPAGEPARCFYQKLGFHPAESAPDGPEGGSRQVYRLDLRLP
jgi:GNAT superfamily N-acetyltransferase